MQQKNQLLVALSYDQQSLLAYPNGTLGEVLHEEKGWIMRDGVTGKLSRLLSSPHGFSIFAEGGASAVPPANIDQNATWIPLLAMISQPRYLHGAP